MVHAGVCPWLIDINQCSPELFKHELEDQSVQKYTVPFLKILVTRGLNKLNIVLIEDRYKVPNIWPHSFTPLLRADTCFAVPRLLASLKDYIHGLGADKCLQNIIYRWSHFMIHQHLRESLSVGFEQVQWLNPFPLTYNVIYRGAHQIFDLVLFQVDECFEENFLTNLVNVLPQFLHDIKEHHR